MKTRRRNSLFTARKKPRLDNLPIDNLEYWLPPEMWEVILSSLDKCSLRRAAQVNRLFRGLIKDVSEAPWPAIDYRLYKPTLDATEKFKWKPKAPGLGAYYEEPFYKSLKNGDIAVAMDDGRLFILRCRSTKWRQFGQHLAVNEEGEQSPRRITDVISLRANEIASCGADGIRIWDNVTATQKYLLSMPSSCAWVAWPILLLKLSNNQFAVGCWDGSVHVWRLGENDQYHYARQLELGDKLPAHSVNQLMLVNNQLHAEFSQFIASWDTKDGRLFARMEFSSLKSALLNAVNHEPKIEGHHLRIENLALDFDWSFPEGFVGVCVDDTYWFLVKLFDGNVKPCFLGFQNSIEWRITSAGDLVVASSVGPFMHDHWIDISANWNPKTNIFSIIFRYEDPDMDEFFIAEDGKIIINTLAYSADTTIKLYDPYQNASHYLSLTLPGGQRFNGIVKQLKSGDLMGYYSVGDTFIWCAKTGKYKASISSEGEFFELPTGDLLKTRYNLFVAPDYMCELNLNVHHFGLRK